jgi:hypothetical protein
MPSSTRIKRAEPISFKPTWTTRLAHHRRGLRILCRPSCQVIGSVYSVEFEYFDVDLRPSVEIKRDVLDCGAIDVRNCLTLGSYYAPAARDRVSAVAAAQAQAGEFEGAMSVRRKALGWDGAIVAELARRGSFEDE